MQWSRTVTSGLRSTSSTTGRAEASAHSMADSSIPRSVRRRPSVWEYMPIRWRALVAFGEAYWTRPSSSTRTRPSPTLGASSVATSSLGNGKVDSVTMVTNRSNRPR